MSEIALKTLHESVAAESRRTRGPKYLCLVDAFRNAIADGRFKPGERVPPETALSASLPVGLGTVQKALTHLAASGLIVRSRRNGTYIADRRSQVSRTFVYRFRDPASGELLLPFVRVLAVTQDGSPGPWRDALGVRRCVRMDRLIWVEQDPPAFSSVYFTMAHGRALLDTSLEELHGTTSHRLLADQFNLPTLRVEHRIGCRPLSHGACESLMLADGTLGTVWDVKDFSIQDRPTLFQRLQLPPTHRPVEIAEEFPPVAGVRTD